MGKQALAVVDDTAIREKQSEVLDSIAHTLEAMKRKAVTHKTQIEFRMQLDNDQYWGLTGSATTKKDVTAGYAGHRAGGVPIASTLGFRCGDHGRRRPGAPGRRRGRRRLLWQRARSRTSS